MIKKIICLALTIILISCLFGCSNEQEYIAKRRFIYPISKVHIDPSLKGITLSGDSNAIIVQVYLHSVERGEFNWTDEDVLDMLESFIVLGYDTRGFVVGVIDPDTLNYNLYEDGTMGIWDPMINFSVRYSVTISENVLINYST